MQRRERTHHKLEDVIVLVDEARVADESLDKDVANDGQEHDFAQREGKDAVERQLGDGPRDAHAPERRPEDEEAEGDRGVADEARRVEEDGEGRVTVWCRRVPAVVVDGREQLREGGPHR